MEQEKLTQQPLIDKALKDAADDSVPIKRARFGTYDLQAREEDQDDAADANDGGMVPPSLKRHKKEQYSS